MRMQRILLLLLVLLLVIGLEVVLMSRCSREEPAGPGGAIATPTPGMTQTTETPDDTAPTVPPIVVNTPVPGFTSPPLTTVPPTRPPTQPPAATQRPAPTNPPTQAPTAAPTNPPPPTVPPASVTASGSFSSDTGAGINMTISWQAVDQGNGTTRLRITGTVNSWSLQVMSQPVSISFSGYSKSLMGGSINYSGSAMGSNSLFTTDLDVATGTSGTMTVTWSYNGTYGSGDNQVSLPSISASDYVYTN